MATMATIEDKEEFEKITEVNWNKMKVLFLKQGYAQGKFEGEDSAIQEGFNKGYEVGYRATFEFAMLGGVVQAVITNVKKKDADPLFLKKAKQLFMEMFELTSFLMDLKLESQIKKYEEAKEAKKNRGDQSIDLLVDDGEPNPNAECILPFSTNQCNLGEKMTALKIRTCQLLEECDCKALISYINETCITI